VTNAHITLDEMYEILITVYR